MTRHLKDDHFQVPILYNLSRLHKYFLFQPKEREFIEKTKNMIKDIINRLMFHRLLNASFTIDILPYFNA